ncbi:uncharacterized protein EV420DRAFT_1648065 [Desarmillaria tabescens]|uniref:Uncharacterized protein n=1 Tax=Armillaria tabescens TaxID=1929756 RepID=A0AA39MUD5_ARMTA|nr:uncharacterized protein EV420DRAFT_1648065 [Desarmillaria tabescens]KAK0446389.1 hypothetical protein EV420DRAFT_1648065 [Desarmillaria tabescens]
MLPPICPRWLTIRGGVMGVDAHIGINNVDQPHGVDFFPLTTTTFRALIVSQGYDGLKPRIFNLRSRAHLDFQVSIAALSKSKSFGELTGPSSLASVVADYVDIIVAVIPNPGCPKMTYHRPASELPTWKQHGDCVKTTHLRPPSKLNQHQDCVETTYFHLPSDIPKDQNYSETTYLRPTSKYQSLGVCREGLGET